MIKVCDSIMGSGKTQAAIKMMKETDGPYIFITLYLDEVDRIMTNCAEKRFVTPVNYGKGKLDNLHRLLRERRNIASTHALFNGYTDETARLIRENGYTLVMDEAFSGFTQIPLKKVDYEALIDSGTITVDPDTHYVKWQKDNDTEYLQEFMEYCESGSLYHYCDTFFMWEFPVGIMDSFETIYVLTYLFKGQSLKKYFDINQMPYEYIHAEKAGGDYTFVDGYRKATGTGFKNKIHIYEGKKINSIGDPEYALSSGWYQRNKDTPVEKKLKNNVLNIFQNIWGVKFPDCLWTTLKRRQRALTPKGFGKCFLQWNAKATNNFSDRHYLAYLVNVYMNPFAKQAFNKMVNGNPYREEADDEYALSEMIQWIWRSAIRKGDDIWIYIPSSRMRKLLKDWLDEVN